MEMATAPPEKKWRKTSGQDRTPSGAKSTDGRIWYKRTRNLSKFLQGGYILLRTVGNDGSSRRRRPSDGQTSESCSEACRWITVELVGQLSTIGVDWWMASNGVEWHKRVLKWKAPLLFQLSCTSVQVGCVFNRKQATSCFVAPFRI